MAREATPLLAWLVIIFAALVTADVDPVVIKVSFKSPFQSLTNIQSRVLISSTRPMAPNSSFEASHINLNRTPHPYQ